MPAGQLRLFVALPVPASIRALLAPRIPATAPGLRPSAPEDLHLTLHFLGLAERAAVEAALEPIVAQVFGLRLGTPGRFLLRGGRSVLFVGIEPTPGLRALHAATAAALAVTGFRPERRPFRPHLTLARTDRDSDDAIVDAFLARSAPAAGFDCEAFALYQSKPETTAARYRLLRSFPLKGPGADN